MDDMSRISRGSACSKLPVSEAIDSGLQENERTRAHAEASSINMFHKLAALADSMLQRFNSVMVAYQVPLLPQSKVSTAWKGGQNASADASVDWQDARWP